MRLMSQGKNLWDWQRPTLLSLSFFKIIFLPVFKPIYKKFFIIPELSLIRSSDPKSDLKFISNSKPIRFPKNYLEKTEVSKKNFKKS